ncbi:MAG: hypothetical protein Q8P35_03400 [Candidatus Yanofskybacteria bacterium]|nr:hypothetical protein [Candidatus Yanofskybacteria bacterium]
MNKANKTPFRYLLLFLLCIVILGFSVESSSFLSSTIFESDQVSTQYDLTIERVIGIIMGLTCWFARIAIAILIGALVFYGIQIIWSRGSQTNYQAAKKSFAAAIIGAFIILGVYTIVATVAGALGVEASFIPLSCPKVL